MDVSSQTHNSSPQQHVKKNDDPALDTANEYVHGHLHHTAQAEEGRASTEYTKGASYGVSGIPNQTTHDQTTHRRHPTTTLPSANPDAEKGDFSREGSEEDPRTHTFSNFYSKYRIFFHLFIWLLFTGLVKHLLLPLRRCSSSIQEDPHMLFREISGWED